MCDCLDGMNPNGTTCTNCQLDIEAERVVAIVAAHNAGLKGEDALSAAFSTVPEPVEESTDEMIEKALVTLVQAMQRGGAETILLTRKEDGDVLLFKQVMIEGVVTMHTVGGFPAAGQTRVTEDTHETVEMLAEAADNGEYSDLLETFRPL